MCSAHHEENLEFFSIKVASGALTSRLQHLKVGDSILVGRKPTGTLIQDNLLPGKTLYMLGTGTGLAPFVSIIKDPETYERYDHLVLVHGCRTIPELGYGELIVKRLQEDEFFGELVREKLLYYPTVTREPFRNMGRRDYLAGNRQAGGRSRPAPTEPGDRPRDAMRQPGYADRSDGVSEKPGVR